MEPVTIGLITAGALQAAGGIASGVGKARAGKKMMLSAAQRKELEDLEARKASGQLGLDEVQRGNIEQQFLAQQAGAQRELEAAGLQQAAARGLGGAVSGREVFLQEQAEAAAERGIRQQQNVAVMDANLDAAQAEADQIRAMNAQQAGAEAQRVAGIWEAASLGLSGAGEATASVTASLHAMAIEEAERERAAEATERLMQQVASGAKLSFNMGL
tara:strand:- start:42 stop:689 length:648 start_codon:yes stop_codon:yes gene_type:complete